jgi:hypothetical protein
MNTLLSLIGLRRKSRMRKPLPVSRVRYQFNLPGIRNFHLLPLSGLRQPFYVFSAFKALRPAAHLKPKG